MSRRAFAFLRSVLISGAVCVMSVGAQTALQLPLSGTTGLADGTYNLTFKLYDQDAPGGTVLYTENQTGISVSGGTFYTQLGPIPPIAFLPSSESVFIATEQIGVGGEVGPRVPVYSAGYAHIARAFIPGATVSADRSDYILSASNGNNGNGRAGLFRITNSNNTGNALEAESNGQLSNAFYARSTGVGGHAATFTVDNTFNGGGAIRALTNSNSATAWVIDALNFGQGAGVGLFDINNPNNNSTALSTSTDGGGRAGSFRIFNAVNSNSALFASTTGRGHGLEAATAGSSDVAGVSGVSTGASGNGVIGEANNGINAYGLWGKSSAGFAGYFSGRVHVNGTLSKTAGSFKIDHPLDPANKYLYHSFVESPDMKNIYDGVVVLDAGGEAWVELPDWFEALNRDFRYQLTNIGAFAPVYVARQVSGHRFQIAGGQPGGKVSWQVTGIRRDRYAEEHRIPVEEKKSATEIGYYLHPELYGQPKSKSVEATKYPEDMRDTLQEK